MRTVGSRVLAVGVLAAAALAVVLVVRAGLSEERTIRAAFDSAENVVPGLEVRMAGRKVGVIRSSKRVNGHAELELEITDDRVWPLRRGTTAGLRFGTTIGYTTRYVELSPADADQPPLADGALLTPDRTETPVEFDDVFRIMDRQGRSDLKAYLASGDAALDGQGAPLGEGLEASAAGLDELSGFMAELERQRGALATLAEAGARTTGALARRRQDLGQLIGGLAATYDELDDHAESTTATLERLPGALQATRGTLERTDTSLARLQTLTRALAPGAERLPGFVSSAKAAVSTLREVAPAATETLRRGAAAMPAVERLLDQGTPFAAQLGRVLGRLAPMMSCLRPYAPEVAGFPATWAGVGKNYDAKDHHTRTLAQVPPFGNGSLMTSEQLVESTPGVVYAFPRPPGFNVGQPWFIPECGAGRDSLDPSKDPESVASSP